MKVYACIWSDGYNARLECVMSSLENAEIWKEAWPFSRYIKEVDVDEDLAEAKREKIENAAEVAKIRKDQERWKK